MTHVLVTGAGGFIGRALVRRLLEGSDTLGAPVQRLTLVDRQLDCEDPLWAGDPRVRWVAGDLADRAVLAQALAEAVDVVFHLASVPGSQAEREPELGLRVNLLAGIELFEGLAKQRARCATRVVFASSVAVYGTLDPSVAVTESTRAAPALSYGAHKRMLEILLADCSRRGVLDGVSLRLPGIVARPPTRSGHGSSFMSDLIRCSLAGEAWVCPVSAQAQAWWMSLPRCIENLIHAAALPAARLPVSRVVQLPVLTATVAQVVHTIEVMTGAAATIRYAPDERLEQLFGRYPALETPAARALGFDDDGDLRRLCERATNPAVIS